jgi:arginase/N-omega-hydroxy-L-arginine amidinohydrolase
LADLLAACAAIVSGDLAGLEIAEFQNAWSDFGEPVSPACLLNAIQPLLSRLPQLPNVKTA